MKPARNFASRSEATSASSLSCHMSLMLDGRRRIAPAAAPSRPAVDFFFTR